VSFSILTCFPPRLNENG